MRVLQPFRQRATYRALVFYVAELVLGVAGFTLLVAGWPITLVCAITPLVIPLLIGLRAAVGLLARAEASVARDLLGARAQTPIMSGGRGSGIAAPPSSATGRSGSSRFTCCSRGRSRSSRSRF